MCKKEVKERKIFDEHILALADAPAFMHNVVKVRHPTFVAHLGTSIAVANNPLFWRVAAKVT
jgi:hypothetical protein